MRGFEVAVKTRHGSRGGMGVQVTPGRNHHDDLLAMEDGHGNGNGRGTNRHPRNDVPTSGGVADREDGPTQEDNTDRRSKMKWTNEMNAYLYRSYLLTTKMETSTEAYSEELYNIMTEKFPKLKSKTAQNIVSQKRQIVKTNRLSQEQISQIRAEVKTLLGITDDRDNEPAEEDLPTLDLDENTDDDSIHVALQRNLMLYEGTDPTKRPNLTRLKTYWQTNRIVQQVNATITPYVSNCNNIEDLQTLVYSAAKTVIEMHEETKPKKRQPNRRNISEIPPWERRITTKIEALRTQIAQLTQSQKGSIAKQKTRKKVEEIIKKHKNNENTNVQEIIDLLKQKLAVLSNRKKRYRESQQRRQQNRQFNNDQRNFYRKLEQQGSNEQIQENINLEHTKQYWEEIWQQPSEHNRKGKWTQMEIKKREKVSVMTPIEITTEDVKRATMKTLNWRAPGIDNIHNYWYKKLTNAHEKMANLFAELVLDPDKTPSFMTTGRTYLLPKSDPPSQDPAKYRPITCLPTIYKILTSIITEKITNHLEANKIIADEQKGSKKESRGCKEQLIIDSVITGDAKKKKKSLFTAYIDYKKAFDSVPHSWLVEILKIYKINPRIITLLQRMMTKWKTTLHITTTGTTTRIGDINIQRGIFQGDSLSALWFCMAMNPLSTILNKENIGYQIGKHTQTISHLLYMDDLKIYSTTKTNMQKMLYKIESFTSDIRMEMGLDKCRINTMERGVWAETENHHIPNTSNPPEYIIGMEAEDTYKYLGFEQNRGINSKKIKQDLMTETKRRITKILKTKLCGQNMVTAVNTYALPVLMYSFGVINWTITDLVNINRQIRVMFTKHRAHHPRSSVERFHLPRKMGGRGVIDMINICMEQIQNLREFFTDRARTSNIHKIIGEIDDKITPLNLKNRNHDVTPNITSNNAKIENWKGKELHGRYIHMIEGDHVDTEASLAWMCDSRIFVETEGFMMAIQDQVIPTLTYKKHILKENVKSVKCRICDRTPETIEHILNGCTILAPNEYMRRHNNVAKIIHQYICRHYDPSVSIIPYYKYKPQNITETQEARIYWDRTIQTDRTVQHNRPDITITEHEKKITYLIDISIPAPANIQTKQNEKIQKYLPLAQDIKEVWQQHKVVIIPIILGATGEVPHKLHEAMKTLELPSWLYKQLQKVVILESASIMRRVLSGNT